MALPRGKSTILQGDCLALLPTLPADHFHAVVTSPPYYALRSYLPAGHEAKAAEIGSEPTPEEFIETMVAVFREVRRVLRPDGVLWVNLGDSYGDATKWGGVSGGKNGRPGANGVQRLARRDRAEVPRTEGGQLQNMPHRVAEALRADGWLWRQTIVWAKRSPMPESVSGWRWQRCRRKVQAGTLSRRIQEGVSDVATFADPKNGHSLAQWSTCPGCHKCEANGGYVLRRGAGRCTTAHEYLFLFAKSSRYFWDSENAKEAATFPKGPNGHVRSPHGQGFTAGRSTGATDGRRNPRTVWTLSSEPTAERHFATFPSELVRRCLAPSLSPAGCCPDCGAQWAPVVDAAFSGSWNDHADDATRGNRQFSDRKQAQRINGSAYRPGYQVPTVLGYRQTCRCPAADPIGCRVLDQFGGIGTVAQTACFLGHDATSLELNQEYIDIAVPRIENPPRWFLRQQAASVKKAKKRKKQRDQLAINFRE